MDLIRFQGRRLREPRISGEEKKHQPSDDYFKLILKFPLTRICNDKQLKTVHKALGERFGLPAETFLR